MPTAGPESVRAESDQARGEPPDATPEAPPPLLGSWRALYVLLLAELGVLIGLFAALTWWAA